MLTHITPNDDRPIIVVGGGETAASVTGYLVDRFSGIHEGSILVLTRSGTIFSRGEGYYENRVFTKHENWTELPADVRRDVIKRADRGVFSIEAAKKIAFATNVEHQFVKVKSVDVSKLDSGVIIINKAIECQMAIFALGFDPFSWGHLFQGEIRKIFDSLADQHIMEANINSDLSVSHPMIQAKLFMPMISAFSQGPGFPNLSCLGLLSDRILDRNRGTLGMDHGRRQLR